MKLNWWSVFWSVCTLYLSSHQVSLLQVPGIFGGQTHKYYYPTTLLQVLVCGNDIMHTCINAPCRFCGSPSTRQGSKSNDNISVYIILQGFTFPNQTCQDWNKSGVQSLPRLGKSRIMFKIYTDIQSNWNKLRSNMPNSGEVEPSHSPDTSYCTETEVTLNINVTLMLHDSTLKSAT